jgi:DNA repair protein RecO (recombination protein O)
MSATGEDVGFLLRTSPLADADLVVHVLARERGQVSAIARAARKSRRRFAGALDFLTLSRYRLIAPRRGELWTLETATLERDWRALASDLVSYAHASYALELARELCPPAEPHPTVVDLIAGLLDSLAAHGGSPAVLRGFELALLGELGSGPVLDACVVCGEQHWEEGGLFDPRRGGVVCSSCAAHSRDVGTRSLSPAARQYLLASTRGPTAAFALDGQIEVTDRTMAREALQAMLGTLLPRPLKSLQFITKLASR